MLAVWLSTDSGPGPQPKLVCQQRMGDLAKIWRLARDAGRFDPTLRGAAQIRSWVAPLRAGEETIFTCPKDPDVIRPDTPEVRARWHPADSHALENEHDLCSFAVRDFVKFPVAPEDRTAWILCDRQGRDGRTPHHKNGISVAFADGHCEFLDRAKLGLRPDEPIVVGPESTHPELRKMQLP